jgi:hypothetical protein
MAQSTAYYEGLQYGENKIPDFGGAAIKGVDRMIELQNDERRRQEKELQFRMKMIQDNPEVAYASFENSGIKNIDTYNTKVAELVKNKFNQLNLKYQEDGDKTAYVMGVSKLKGEVMNYTTHVKPMIEYGQKVTELGENASAVMYDNVERIDAAMQFGVPSMSPDGTLSNVSVVPQDDGSYKKDQIAFGEMQSLTSIHQRQDKFGLAANAVKSFGEDSRFVDDKGRVVLSTLLTKDGKLQGSAERIIRADVSALGRSSLVDIADQFGVRAQYGSNGELLNRKELVDAVAEEEVKYATSLIQEQQKEDELAYEELDLKAQRLRLAAQRERRQSGKEALATSFEYTPQMAQQYTDVFGQEGTGFVEHIMKDDRSKFVSAFPNFIDILAPTLSGPLTSDQDKSAFGTIKSGIVQALWEHPSGQHGVVVTVPSEIPQKYLVDDVEKVKWKDSTNTYFFPINSATQANSLRAMFNLGDMNQEQKQFWAGKRGATNKRGILD